MMSGQPAGLASSASQIEESRIAPKYLHSNSTSHEGPFSAIAELIDNAYDPDCSAKDFYIDLELINGKRCLVFTDNGSGVTYQTMCRMMSFGFCEKEAVGDHRPVGHYGNGFKSGSMRLGKDALVLSRTDNTECVGLLSQTYLTSINASAVKVPMFSWTLPDRHITTLSGGEVGQMASRSGPAANTVLPIILDNSPLNSERDIHAQMRILEEKSVRGNGTRIIVFNLRGEDLGELELNTAIDQHDLQVARGLVSQITDRRMVMAAVNRMPVNSNVPHDIIKTSLRAYCSVLYMKPRMGIYIRGKKVKTRYLEKELRKVERDQYRPRDEPRPVAMTFGLSRKVDSPFGMMLYHNNRLIKGFVRMGIQQKANAEAVGVIGIIDCDFLKPTHNKQEFDGTAAYNLCMTAVQEKLKQYWYRITHRETTNSVTGQVVVVEDVSESLVNGPEIANGLPWVQCSNCKRWRRLFEKLDEESQDDDWFCYMNNDKAYADCSVPEQTEEDASEAAAAPRKKKLRPPKRPSKAEQTRKESEERLAQQQKELEEQKKKLEREMDQLRRMEEERAEERAELDKQRQQVAAAVIRSRESTASSAGGSICAASPVFSLSPTSPITPSSPKTLDAASATVARQNRVSATSCALSVSRSEPVSPTAPSPTSTLASCGSSLGTADPSPSATPATSPPAATKGLFADNDDSQAAVVSVKAEPVEGCGVRVVQCWKCQKWRQLDRSLFNRIEAGVPWNCSMNPGTIGSYSCTFPQTLSSDAVSGLDPECKKPRAGAATGTPDSLQKVSVSSSDHAQPHGQGSPAKPGPAVSGPRGSTAVGVDDDDDDELPSSGLFPAPQQTTARRANDAAFDRVAPKRGPQSPPRTNGGGDVVTNGIEEEDACEYSQEPSPAFLTPYMRGGQHDADADGDAAPSSSVCWNNGEDERGSPGLFDSGTLQSGPISSDSEANDVFCTPTASPTMLARREPGSKEPSSLAAPATPACTAAGTIAQRKRRHDKGNTSDGDDVSNLDGAPQAKYKFQPGEGRSSEREPFLASKLKILESRCQELQQALDRKDGELVEAKRKHIEVSIRGQEFQLALDRMESQLVEAKRSHSEASVRCQEFQLALDRKESQLVEAKRSHSEVSVRCQEFQLALVEAKRSQSEVSVRCYELQLALDRKESQLIESKRSPESEVSARCQNLESELEVQVAANRQLSAKLDKAMASTKQLRRSGIEHSTQSIPRWAGKLEP